MHCMIYNPQSTDDKSVLLWQTTGSTTRCDNLKSRRARHVQHIGKQRPEITDCIEETYWISLWGGPRWHCGWVSRCEGQGIHGLETPSWNRKNLTLISRRRIHSLDEQYEKTWKTARISSTHYLGGGEALLGGGGERPRFGASGELQGKAWSKKAMQGSKIYPFTYSPPLPLSFP